MKKFNQTVSKVPLKGSFICNLIGCCFATKDSYVCEWCGCVDSDRHFKHLTKGVRKLAGAFNNFADSVSKAVTPTLKAIGDSFRSLEQKSVRTALKEASFDTEDIDSFINKIYGEDNAKK